MPLSPSHLVTIDRFLLEQDMPGLYRAYQWKGDTWERGFPDLLRLEQALSRAAREYSLNRNHLLDVAAWGDLPNPKRISCPDPIRITLYLDGTPACWLMREPENAICILGCQIRGFGPTYCSKVLHFAVPRVFGALDTRLVRVFGNGDGLCVNQYQLLNLYAAQQNSHWTIPSTQEGWPREYGTWVEILNHIAQTLNGDGIACPHPPQYYRPLALREEGIWLPADVETALFSYASRTIRGSKSVA